MHGYWLMVLEAQDFLKIPGKRGEKKSPSGSKIFVNKKIRYKACISLKTFPDNL